jgi:small-conductance mechanosensitive channel
VFLRTKTEDGERHIEVLRDPNGSTLVASLVVDQNNWLYVGVPNDEDVVKVTQRMLKFLDEVEEDGNEVSKFNILWDRIQSENNLLKVVL